MDLRARLLSGDLVAGGIAVALFLLLAVGLNASWGIAVVFAVAAYVAIVWARLRLGGQPGASAADTAERSELAYETSTAKVAAIRALATRVQKAGTRELVLRICDQSDRSLAAMKTTGSISPAPLFLEQLLEPAEALLESYVRFASRGVAAAELLTRNEAQDLPMIERAARLFAESVEQGETDPAALAKTLDFAPETATPVTPRR